MAKNKIVNGTLEYMQFIVTDSTINEDMLEDTDHLAEFIKSGKVVRVRYNQDPSKYEDTTLYEYQATEGKGDERKEVTRYAVAIKDAKRSPRATSAIKKDALQALLAEGLTPEQLQAKLQSLLQ